MRRIKRIFLYLIFLSVTLCGCAGVSNDASTGGPVKNYEVTLKTVSDLEPVASQFYIVRLVNKGKYQYDPEYYDILKEAVISHLEAERTLCLRIVIRILNPTGTKFSLTYRMRSLSLIEGDKGNWVTKDEVVYSGKELDIQRSIDCPITAGQYETGLWVYRGGFLLFEFANFKYKVES